MSGAIDFMCYLFTPEASKRNWLEEPEMSRLVQWWRMEDRVRGFSVKEWVQMMDEGGVDKILINATKMKSFKHDRMVWDVSEQEVYDFVSQAPGRLYGIAGCNPFKRLDGVKHLEWAVKELGFKGLYIHTYGYNIPLDHRLYYPWYAKCAELGIPVSMQVGHSAEHMPNEMGRPITLDAVALDFPEVNFIGAHTGWPWVEEMIALAWKHENVYIGIDAHDPKYLDKSLATFLRTRGQDKVLFGTNYPAVLHKPAIDYIKNEMGLKESVAQKILRDNSARLYRL